MELAELRALRTPVPVRPAGMPAVSGEEKPEPTPERAKSVESSSDAPTTPEASAPAPSKRPVTIEEELPPEPPKPAPTRAATPTPVPSARAPLAESPIKPLPATPSSQRLPWMLVGALGLAVAGLVAYIVST
jgi:hypothetical protein